MKNCIYRFKNKSKEIIYIGKAKELNRRIKAHSHLPAECYEELKTIEYILLKTIDDIDLAERYLVAKNKPKYNEALKNKNISFRIKYLDNKKWTILENSKFYNIDDMLKDEVPKTTKKDNETPDLFKKWLCDKYNIKYN